MTKSGLQSLTNFLFLLIKTPVTVISSPALIVLTKVLIIFYNNKIN